MNEGSAEPVERKQSWAWPITWMVCFGVLMAGTVFLIRSCQKMPAEAIEKAGGVVEKTGTAIEKAGASLSRVAAAFKQGTITTSFVSYATTLGPSQRLQIANLRQMELFTRSDERTLGYLTLPEVVVEARAPIEYTYYVDLTAPWRFVLRDDVLWAYPPEIRFNTPAVDVSRIEYEIRKGRIGSSQVKEDLKRSISYLAREKAKENTGLVRETARTEISHFVETWLMKNFSDGRNYPVKVVFPGETHDQPLPPPATNER